MSNANKAAARLIQRLAAVSNYEKERQVHKQRTETRALMRSELLERVRSDAETDRKGSMANVIAHRDAQAQRRKNRMTAGQLEDARQAARQAAKQRAVDGLVSAADAFASIDVKE